MSASGLSYGKVASYILLLLFSSFLTNRLHTEKSTCIFTGFKPCLKIFITVGCGFGLSKRGLMPQAGSKAMSQVAINISLPCLLFSNIVPAFKSDNVKNLGPLFMMAFGYQIIGGTLALIVRELFYVPKDFQYGILVLGIMSNWGNISTAIVSSVTQDKPFNPATDLQLGIAYIAVFIISNNIIMYGAGLFRVIALDLRDDRPEVPRTLASRLSHRRQQLQRLKHRITNRRHGSTEAEPASPKTSAISLRKVQDPESAPATTTAEPTGEILAERPFDSSFRSRQNNSEPEILPVLSRSASISSIDAKVKDNPPMSIPPAPTSISHAHESVKSVVVKRIKAFASPPTVAVIVSLLVALVPPLKALMVPVEGWSGSKISNAPDGGAPLAFLYDSAEFIGQIMMPASLIILGAAFARLKLSRRRLKEMPLPAIAAMTVAKLCIMPTIGILSTRSLSRHTTLFPPDQKMLSFIPYLLSGTPSSNSQIALTTLVLRDGQTVDIVAAFMLAQYAVLILQNSALTAISLYLVS